MRAAQSRDAVEDKKQYGVHFFDEGVRAAQQSLCGVAIRIYACVSARAILTTREAPIFTCSSVTAPLSIPCSRLS